MKIQERKQKEWINKQNNQKNKPTKAEIIPSNIYLQITRKRRMKSSWMLRLYHPLREKKWRISSFANSAYSKMKNNSLAFDPTHWIHHEGLNIILVQKRLKRIWVSQTDIDHWFQPEEGIIHYHKDRLNQCYIPNWSFSHTRPEFNLCCL